jgi:hypothetical protein
MSEKQMAWFNEQIWQDLLKKAVAQKGLLLSMIMMTMYWYTLSYYALEAIA